MMRIKKIIFIICLLATKFSYSQLLTEPQAQWLRIYFAEASAHLSDENKMRLDSVAEALPKNIRNYVFEVIGHSDSTGGYSANKKMSVKRAAQCRQYLISQGVPSSMINVSGLSDDCPLLSNSTEEGRDGNRRVEIILRLKKFVPDNIAGVRLRPSKFTINAGEGSRVNYESGTKITIPDNAFVDQDGNPVKGNIDLFYEEYRDPIDFILSGIPMTMEKDGVPYVFNSAGMFKILASQNGQALRLAKPLKVDFVQTQTIEETNLFEYDTIRKTWNQRPDDADCSGSIGRQFSNLDFSHGMNGSYCQGMSNYGNPNYISSTGLEMITSQRQLYQEIMRRDTVGVLRAVEIRDSLIFKADSLTKLNYKLKKEVTHSTHKYKVFIADQSRNRIKFKLACVSGKDNELRKVNSAVIWKYRLVDDPTLIKKLRKHTWTDCEIDKEGERYTIRLENNETTIVLNDVQLQLVADVAAEEKDKYLSDLWQEHAEVREKYLVHLQEITSKQEEVSDSLEVVVLRRNAYQDYYIEHNRLYQWITESEVYCFWSMNQRMMKFAESRLRFERWLLYFDTHHAEMETRYTQMKIRNTTRPAATNNMAAPSANNTKLTYSDSLNLLMRSLCIGSLGVYNIDALQKLGINDDIDVSFYDKKGSEIQTLVVYLFLKDINTVLPFSSVEDGKVHIKYDKDRKSRLLILDTKQQAYLCSTSFFEALEKGNGLRHEGKVEAFKLIKITRKKELKKMLDL